MVAALLPWIALMVAGFIAGVLLLIWGLQSGQFSEQERARFLPLRDNDLPSSSSGGSSGVRQLRLFIALLAALCLFLIAALWITVLNKGAG